MKFVSRFVSFVSFVAVALFVVSVVDCTTALAREKAAGFAWQTASASKATTGTAKSPSESYYHRTGAYLKSITLTPEQTAKIDALQKSAAADIDNAETHKAATAAFHASVLGLLTPEQLKTVQAAHKRSVKVDDAGNPVKATRKSKTDKTDKSNPEA